MRLGRPVLLVAMLVVPALLAGCMTTRTEQGLGGQSSTASGIGAYSRSEQWNPFGATEEVRDSWPNAFPRAYYSVSGELGPGVLRIEVLDAAGATVASFTVDGPGQVSENGQTLRGEPGDWTIVIERRALSGQLSISMTGSG